MKKEQEIISDFVKLFDELLAEYKEIKEKYIWETSIADEGTDKRELNSSIKKFSDRKDSLIKQTDFGHI